VAIVKTQTAPNGVTPAIVLENPKWPRNVGYILRSAYNFGVEQLIITGDRVPLNVGSKKYRLPREERFKEYLKVNLERDDHPFDRFGRDVSIIGVELILGSSMPITYFEHPEKAVYVFGPEDGDISQSFRRHIHQFIYVSTLSCLNLAVITGVVLADRLQKDQLAGKVPVRSVEETLSRYRAQRERELLDDQDPVFTPQSG
jgi:tRNA(Leu) C34 or U34 (ribose-2'-O)-methylase TrmL